MSANNYEQEYGGCRSRRDCFGVTYGLSGVQPPRCDHVVWISICAALHREPHLVNVIELGVEPDEFLVDVEDKNLLGYPLTIIKPEHLDLEIVCIERREVAVVEIEIIVLIRRFEAGRFPGHVEGGCLSGADRIAVAGSPLEILVISGDEVVPVQLAE